MEVEFHIEIDPLNKLDGLIILHQSIFPLSISRFSFLPVRLFRLCLEENFPLALIRFLGW